jgi:hypothetical protein
MDELRLGDMVDDYCIKCRRLTNHAIVSMMEGEVAKVRCRSCYHEHNYLREQIPPSKKDLKKAELFNAVLAKVDSPGPATESAAAENAAEGEAEPAAVSEGSVGAESAPEAKKGRGRTKKT